jgi:hypothetical protein
MSGASHESIQAWKKAFKRSQNAIIDPVEEFDRDLSGVPENELTPQEERYLTRKIIREYCGC